MKKALLILGLIVGVSFVGAASAQAASFRTDNQASLGEDELIEGTLYTAGKNVTIAGTVRGDVFCAGETVEVTGVVEGDLICAAQQLTVKGSVNGNVRAAGQIVNLAGVIDGSLTVAGQNITLESTGQVGMDATALGQTVKIDGLIGRDLVGGSSSLTIGNVIGRDVNVSVETLLVTSAAKVGGDLRYVSDAELSAQEGAVIKGATDRTPPTTDRSSNTTVYSAFALSIYWFGAMLVLGLAVLLIKPNVLAATTEQLTARPLLTLGWGLVGLLVVPLAGLLVMVTVVGVPLGLLMWLLWAAALMLSGVFAAHCTGNWILKRLKVGWNDRLHSLLALLSGLVVLMLLSLIPFIGWLVGLAIIVWGIGSLSYTFTAPKTTKRVKTPVKETV